MFQVDVDERSKKIVLVAHCVLNQNSVVNGIARFPGMIIDVVQIFGEKGVGVIQLPCPELLFAGLQRHKMRRDGYNTPDFLSLCDKVLVDVIKQIETYTKNGYKILCIIGIARSPSCGVKTTRTTVHRKNGKTFGRTARGKGIFMGCLVTKLKNEGYDIPLIEIPWDFGKDEQETSKFLNELKVLLDKK
jgi:predicted secreted protein